MFNFKKITLLKFTILGIIFTVITGTLLHFVYDLSNGNPVVGLFAPINESVWEHLKLLFYPATLWITIGYKKFGKNNCNYLFPAFSGVVSGLITIPVLFYLYTFILKKDILVLDILIFIIGVIVCFSVFYFAQKNYNFCFISNKKVILLWEIVFILFVLFTVYPPALPLFKDYS